MGLLLSTVLKVCTEIIKKSKYYLLKQIDHYIKSHYTAILVKSQKSPELVLSLHSRTKTELEIFVMSWTYIGPDFILILLRILNK